MADTYRRSLALMPELLLCCAGCLLVAAAGNGMLPRRPVATECIHPFKSMLDASRCVPPGTCSDAGCTPVRAESSVSTG